MKTTRKEIKTAIREHIQECVINYHSDEPFDTIEETIQYMFSEFDRVANYPNNLAKIPNEFERFSDYLNGLPFNFEFYYYEINKFLERIGLPQPESKSDQDSNQLYHWLIYREAKQIKERS